MKSKLIAMPYTLLILKPKMVAIAAKRDKIMEGLEEIEMDIFHRIQKVLTKQEINNLYRKYERNTFYEDIEDYLMSGESLILLLVNRKDERWDEEKEEYVKQEHPIQRIKKLIGDKDPSDAEEGTLRQLLGTDLIQNCFFSSDTPRDANRERAIFNIPTPEKIPDFLYLRNKIELQDLSKFLFPEHLEHCNTTGRLDVVGMYGPIVNYHSVDGCFCIKCMPKAKGELKTQVDVHMKTITDMAKTGETIQKTMITTMGKSTKSKSKITKGPIRLLEEEAINQIKSDLCDNCQDHVNKYTHIICGREGQHILTDIEITELINEMNRTDLLRLLTVEKGTTGKLMVDSIELKQPPELLYKAEHIAALFKDLETDYYDRIDYNQMQKIILEDRRLRMNYWISKILAKPIEKFKNGNLVTKNPKVVRDDIANHYYATRNMLPISLRMEAKQEKKHVEINKKTFDQTIKLQQNELDFQVERTIATKTHMIADVADVNNRSVATNTLILRDYNPGLHGDWNNYCCLKGQIPGTFVKKHKKIIPE